MLKFVRKKRVNIFMVLLTSLCFCASMNANDLVTEFQHTCEVEYKLFTNIL